MLHALKRCARECGRTALLKASKEDTEAAVEALTSLGIDLAQRREREEAASFYRKTLAAFELSGLRLERALPYKLASLLASLIG